MSFSLIGPQNAIRAGDTLVFNVDLSEFPASAGWGLKYYLTRQGVAVVGTGAQEAPEGSIGGSASGSGSAFGSGSGWGSGSGSGDAGSDNFVVTVPAPEAAKLTPGLWAQALVFTLGDVRQTVGMPSVQVLPDPANPALTINRQIANNLEAIIQGRSMPFQDVESSNINGQQIINMTSADLMKWLIFYKSKANAEDERGTPRSPAQVRPFYL
jgi:hypothetical protein